MTLPSWPQTATPPAALFYSRITRSEPGEWPILTHPPVYKPSSTAFVTEHNHRCLIISSHLSPVLVSDWSAHPPSSQTHQPVYHPDLSSRTPFGEKPAAVTGPSGDQEQLNSTICMFTEITVLKFTVYLSWSTASLFFLKNSR